MLMERDKILEEFKAGVYNDHPQGIELLELGLEAMVAKGMIEARKAIRDADRAIELLDIREAECMKVVEYARKMIDNYEKDNSTNSRNETTKD